MNNIDFRGNHFAQQRAGSPIKYDPRLRGERPEFEATEIVATCDRDGTRHYYLIDGTQAEAFRFWAESVERRLLVDCDGNSDGELTFATPVEFFGE